MFAAILALPLLYAAVTYFGTMSRLHRDVITNVALATGATTTYDVECSEADWLVVQGDLTGTANGDLTVTVTPFEDDGITLSGINIAATTSVGPTLTAGHVYFLGKYDVIGVGRVRITWKNNNAAGQTLTRGSWRTAGY